MIETDSGILSRLVLNEVQREAVVYSGGPQLVFAGAGTGKTRVLTAKIAWLIESGVSPSHLFAATFTNKAAREMRSRVEKYVGRSTEGMWVGTFHSLCARMLRRECGLIGYKKDFSIYDDADQTALIRKIIKELGIDERTVSPRHILADISKYKNRCIRPSEALEAADGFFKREIVRVYCAYQEALVERQAMDFDDLLMNTVILLRENPLILEAYQQHFEYILVDEYQDTNNAQLSLLRLLASRHQRIFAVGDDDQSIYGWRGAQIENILMFERDFPSAKIFKLEQNYRSCAAILNFANAAIAVNSRRASKKLWTDRCRGGRVVVTCYRDDRHEASAIAERINKERSEKIRLGEIAVLFRTNAQSRVFEEAFLKRRIPYVLVGGVSFYERAEIKDCLAYLRLLVNVRDDVAFERIYNMPPRGLGEKALEILSQKATQKGASLLETLLSIDPVDFGDRFKRGFSELREIFELLIDEAHRGVSAHELLGETLRLSRYTEALSEQKTEEAASRLENINELLNAITIWSRENPTKGLPEFLEEAALSSDIDKWHQRDDSVNLMTLHCAKGLEFRTVFIVGCEEGLLPSHQNSDDDVKIEEERRLLYVGATRAMERLFCSYAERRYRFGELMPRSPSRFLLSIDPSLYEKADETAYCGSFPKEERISRSKGREEVRFVRADIAEKKIERNRFLTDEDFSQDVVEYRIGQYVRHKNYGRGRIVGISGFGSDMKLTVLFNDGERRKLMARFARFEGN